MRTWIKGGLAGMIGVTLSAAFTSATVETRPGFWWYWAAAVVFVWTLMFVVRNRID